MARKDAPLVVEVPQPQADRPAWGKVGIVAILGFGLGIAWPRVTGTRVAHPPHAESTGASAEAPAVNASAVPAVAPASSARAESREPTVQVGRGAIVRCRDGDQETVQDCGSLQFDPIAVPVIQGLAHCKSAKVPSGQLSLGFDVDFRKKTVHPLLGKNSTVDAAVGQDLIKCAESSLENVLLGEIKHRHRRYTLYYNAAFSPPGQPPAAPLPSMTAEGPEVGVTTNETPITGSASVAWDVAVVRDTPKSGTIVARILRGTKVKLMARQGEWVRIRSGSVEGWAYRGALGM